MGGGKSGGKMNVVDYRISLHLGVCVGPADSIGGIRISDKPIGNPTVTANTTWNVDNKDLFGGPKKGGGINGTIHFLLGSASQLLSGLLASKYGRTPTTMTGYRDITSIFLTAQGTSTDGFTIGANNPVVPNVDVTVSRFPKGLGDGLHVIEPPDSTPIGEIFGPEIGADANPAHIIYECLTNDHFGVGYAVSQVDLPSFLAASQTLYDENFGLSYQWMTSTPVEQFVNEVLETISANMSFNLVTGKWEIKLLRGDYDIETIPTIHPGNANLTNFQRRGWGETINEVVLTWTNPQNEEDETVTIHDNNNIAIQGTVVSDGSKNFPGIRNGELAMKVGERELRQSSAPLAAAEVEVDRTLWKLKPGEAVKFLWPEYGIHAPIVMRVLKTNYGKRGAPSINVSLLEDVFSFGQVITQSQGSEASDPSQDPIDPPHILISAPPYYLYANEVGDRDAAATDFPETTSLLLASSGLTDIRNIDVLSLETQADDTQAFDEAATIGETYRFTLGEPLPISPDTSIIPVTADQRSHMRVGNFLLLTFASASQLQEIVKISAATADSITVQRGLLDTVPRAWATGAAVWVLARNGNMIDRTLRSIGETVNYKFLPITSLGRLSESQATTHEETLPSRLQAPLRPARTRLNGNDIGTVTQIAPSEDVAATWANRNRLTETGTALNWSAGVTAPEAGQTTRLIIRDETSTIATLSDITGNSYTITAAELGNPVAGDDRYIRFQSRRDGINSIHFAEMKVEIR